uniref:Uncharacterized protein n=1 Tax=Rhizophora mucronata TaxID=61149 RepID=A0A2P2Q4Q5_RHIMU
MQWLLENIKH